MAINDAFLSDLKARTDIMDLVSSYVSLDSRRQGRTHKGLCPFHNEKTPSFMVYEDTQSFYCFGCGAGGDAITFTMKIENLDYIEAVKLLAERAGLSMPETGYDDSLTQKKNRILAANREAARFFYSCLVDEKNSHALNYFLNRGLTPQTIKKFGLGYAPDSWDSLIKHMRAKGFSVQELYEADLVKKSTKNGERFYDNFRNRMITPIIDIRGNVIGFGGRVLDDSKPKYVNTADTLVYKKSHEVFAMNYAKNAKEDFFIVAEGYMDVIALHQAGFTNAVACLGTALTTEQARLMKRYTDEVVLAYDSDEAGQKATKRAMQIFASSGLKVRVLQLKGGKDPDEIIKKHGRERFQSLLDGAENDTEFNLIKIGEKYDLSTSDGKSGFLKEASQFLATLSSPVERETYCLKLASMTEVSADAIRQEIKRNLSTVRKREKKELYSHAKNLSSGAEDKINPEKRKFRKEAMAEEIIITTLFRNPDFYRRVKDELTPELFFTSFNRRVLTVLLSLLENGRELDVSSFRDNFSADEMGRITFLSDICNEVSDTLEECLECIEMLKKAKNKKSSAEISDMSDEDFANMFKNMHT
ncbi:MAG: DNA primase [Ruminococcaceae bacterium]|nr:DNA primase [Oscillospiraceae bacterium]